MNAAAGKTVIAHVATMLTAVRAVKDAARICSGSSVGRLRQPWVRRSARSVGQRCRAAGRGGGMHCAGKHRQARGSEHIGLCRARVTVAERLGDNGAPGVTVIEPHAAGPAKAMRADPGGVDPGHCQDGPGQAGELVGWEFGGEIRVDG
jgi:hypothetical protein